MIVKQKVYDLTLVNPEDMEFVEDPIDGGQVLRALRHNEEAMPYENWPVEVDFAHGTIWNNYFLILGGYFQVTQGLHSA